MTVIVADINQVIILFEILRISAVTTLILLIEIFEVVFGNHIFLYFVYTLLFPNCHILVGRERSKILRIRLQKLFRYFGQIALRCYEIDNFLFRLKLTEILLRSFDQVILTPFRIFDIVGNP